eukprot:353510-Chlamydomonas_euryale.AAC.1
MVTRALARPVHPGIWTTNEQRESSSRLLRIGGAHGRRGGWREYVGCSTRVGLFWAGGPGQAQEASVHVWVGCAGHPQAPISYARIVTRKATLKKGRQRGVGAPCP